RSFGGDRDGVRKSALVADDMVGRQKKDDSARIFFSDHERGDGRRRRSVAARRLEYDGGRIDRRPPHLLRDEETVLLVADDGHGAEAGTADAQGGVLDERALTGQGEQLFWKKTAGKWPKP